MTDVGVFEAVSKSKSLKTLKIAYCRSITKTVITLLGRVSVLNSLLLTLPDKHLPFDEADVADLRRNSIWLQVLQRDASTTICKSLPWRR